MDEISAVYHVSCAASDAARIARAIAVEQTVEVPEGLIDERIEREIVGTVAAVDPLDGGRFAVRIDFGAALAGRRLPQLLNLVYGNVSIMEGVRLAALELPASLLDCFAGPNLGGAGVRSLIGVEGRPLLATALKPRGLDDAALAGIAGAFARGGGDLVKDDHNLVDDSFEAYVRRVRGCQNAVQESNAATGRNCVYVPNLCVPLEELSRCAEAVLDLGIKGVMVAPLILGLDTVRHLTTRYPLFVVGHPAFTGAFFQDRDHGIDMGILLGTLYRLAGVDISIIVNHGGRFAYTPAECAAAAQAVRAPLGALKPGLPCPAGGMRFDGIPDMVAQYGVDTLLLIGGALLLHTDSVRASTEAFLDRIREQL